MNRLSDICACNREPLHTVGFCAVLMKAERERAKPRLLYASKLDAKLTRKRLPK